jgi:hypothetical protein
MELISSNWNSSGVCLKHYIQMTPCPQCLAEKDEDVQVFVTEYDRQFIDSQRSLGDKKASIKDLLPQKHVDWLIERIV